MKNYRIVKRSHRAYGTWFVIQKRIILWWHDLPAIYKDFDDAVLDLMENHDHLNEDVCEEIEVSLGV